MMTIKNQFRLLSTVLITIPLICVSFIVFQNYMKSPRHLLLKGSLDIEKMDPKHISKDEVNNLGEYIRMFPPGTGIAICNENMVVIFSNMEEINVNSLASKSYLQQIITDSSSQYWYQITKQEFGEEKFYILNRVPNAIQRPSAKYVWTHGLFIILFIVSLALFIIVLRIFTNVFHSIKYIQQYTENLAEGNFENQENIKPEHAGNEIVSIADSIEKVRCSLMEAQQQKNKFIMGISHDLRTPIAIIKGYTEAINDGIITDQEEIQQTRELVLLKANQLERMVDSLINFVKLNTFDSRDKMVSQSITTAIKSFADEAITTGSVFNRNITSDIQLEKDYLTPFDKDLAERAFQNIFSNALRYTEENDSITISAKADSINIYLSISDTGCGMSEEDKNHIFELFYRATNSRREEGMGIGLSVVKNIMEIHGWTIGVESKLNEGSTFTITIPVEAQEGKA